MTQAHEVELSKPAADMLLEIAAMMGAEKVGIATIWNTSNLAGLSFDVEVGALTKTFTGFTNNPVNEMALLKLVDGQSQEIMATITLSVLGKQWVEYQRKGRAGKWLARRASSITRVPRDIKEVAEFIGTVGTATGVLYFLLRWFKLVP